MKKSHPILIHRMTLYLSIWSFTFIISFQDYWVFQIVGPPLIFFLTFFDPSWDSASVCTSVSIWSDPLSIDLRLCIILSKCLSDFVSRCFSSTCLIILFGSRSTSSSLLRILIFLILSDHSVVRFILINSSFCKVFHLPIGPYLRSRDFCISFLLVTL